MTNVQALTYIGIAMGALNFASWAWMAWHHYTVPSYRVLTTSVSGRLYVGSWGGMLLTIVIAAFVGN